MSQYVFTVDGRAGATASLICSLCQAGTYGTGSGQGQTMSLGFGFDPLVIHIHCFSLLSFAEIDLHEFAFAVDYG
jgi:hypothetical protein